MDPLAGAKRNRDAALSRVVGRGRQLRKTADEAASERFWAPKTDFPDRAAFDEALERARKEGKKARRT